MTGKEFLTQIRDINITIIGYQLEIERIDTKLTSTTIKPKEVDVQTSLPADPMADKIIERLDYEEKLIDALNRQMRIKTAALDMLDRLHSQGDKAVLILRYINCMSYKEMCENLDCSRPTAARKLTQAEANFEKVYAMQQNET